MTESVSVDIDLVPTTLQELKERSELIINGVVLKVLPSVLSRDLATNRQVVYTDSVVGVLDVYKGSLPDHRQSITVRTLGGETPELLMSVDRSPKFTPREEVILLLKRDPGLHFPLEDPYLFTVAGYDLGKYGIKGNHVWAAHDQRILNDQGIRTARGFRKFLQS